LGHRQQIVWPELQHRAHALRDDLAQRLAAFCHDGSQHPARRTEAEGVLRLYQQRREDLDARLALGDPEIVPLGLLMLIPDTLTP
jgi:Mn-dependent DtxR family transcriptional regulator